VTEPFIGTNDLSDALGEDVSTSDLAVIAIDAACEQIRAELGNPVNLQEDDEVTLDGNGRPRLILPAGPVRAVSEVELDGVALETTDYVLEDGRRWHGMYLRRVGPSTIPAIIWPVGLGNVAITYDHGWDVTESLSDPPLGFERVPSAIRQVALGLAVRVYRGFASGASTGATTSLRLGSAAETFDVASAVAASTPQLSEPELAALFPWRELTFA
jgi:hypothetical protein